jgi:endonuclease YncB( thermonuclease family)
MKDTSFFFTLLFIAVQAIITPAAAINQWSGVVTHITDGDTLWIQPNGAASIIAPRKIRVDGIDAPESCQLYGAQSTAALKIMAVMSPKSRSTIWMWAAGWCVTGMLGRTITGTVLGLTVSKKKPLHNLV